MRFDPYWCSYPGAYRNSINRHQHDIRYRFKSIALLYRNRFEMNALQHGSCDAMASEAWQTTFTSIWLLPTLQDVCHRLVVFSCLAQIINQESRIKILHYFDRVQRNKVRINVQELRSEM